MFKRKAVKLRKLIVCSAEHGDLTMTKPKDIKKEFERIMKAGYGGKIPAVFHAEMKDGSHKMLKGKDAKDIIFDPEVEEVTVVPQIVGG